MKVYIASSWASAPMVRAMHIAIRALGWTPTSTWAEAATSDVDDCETQPDDVVDAQWQANHKAASTADVVIVRADSGGRETFAEAATAFQHGRSVVWVGKPTYSALKFRHLVTRVDSDAEAFAALATLGPVTMRSPTALDQHIAAVREWDGAARDVAKGGA